MPMPMPTAPTRSMLTAIAIAITIATGWVMTPNRAGAATAYVTDELVLGVYAEQTAQGQRLATLHSGATLETLSVSGDFTQVRLSDGTVGWVKSTYLTTREPATARLKELEEELERNPAARAAAPAANATPAGDDTHASDATHAGGDTPPSGYTPASADTAGSTAAAPRDARSLGGAGPALARPSSVLRRFAPLTAAAVVSLGVGYLIGHATLARRIRRKFGGIKVY